MATHLKKFVSIMLFAVLLLSAVTCLGATELKLGGTSPVGSLHDEMAQTFAKNLSEVSDGNLTLSVNMGGVLGNAMAHFSQLKQGDLDFYIASLDTASGLQGGEDLAVVLVPFLFQGKDHYEKFLASDLFKDMMSKAESNHGLKFLGTLCRQLPRGLSTSKVAVHSIEDVKNLKIRVPEATAMTEIWKAWGANPTIIGGGELYSALQSGLADGQDNDVITTYKNAYDEVQDYYTELEYIYQNMFLYASAKNYENYTDEQKTWIAEAMSKTYNEFDEKLEAMYQEAKQGLIDKGMEFVDADIQSFRDATVSAVGQFDGKLYSEGLFEKIQALAD